ncbi:hypothetical protein O8E94_003128 [Yersinia ruckeri]|nr:hypothetical protein [Yersinia ruckeri]
MEKSNMESLCFEFFREFSRYEYCLKATQSKLQDGNAKANWDLFANDVRSVFTSSRDSDFVAAIDFFTKYPPKKQVVRHGVLEWDTTPLKESSVALKMFILIRRVRNNLFHGGKFNGNWFEPERSELLMKHALVILKICGQSHPDVSKAYEDKTL